MADHRIGEIDLDVDAKTAPVRSQFAERLALLHPDRFQNLDEAARCRLLDNTSLIDRGDERRRAAIHNRHFRSVEFNGCIVDPKASQCSKNVFGGGYKRALLVAQDSGKLGRGHGFYRSSHPTFGSIGTDTDKNKTRIDRGRPKGQIDW